MKILQKHQPSLPRLKILRHAALLLTASLLLACTAPPPVPPAPTGEQLNATPNLTRLARFDIFTQREPIQKLSGKLVFKESASLLEAKTEADQSVGRLLIQPEVCRDDPSSNCQRRFMAAGILDVLNTSLNCYVAIRNDSSTGYFNQAFSGICQDKNGRNFSITLYSE
jgi:hypothetical protein